MGNAFVVGPEWCAIAVEMQNGGGGRRARSPAAL
jgi:hypothetical protein